MLRQEDLNDIFRLLLEAEIAEKNDLPCTAKTIRASAILALNLSRTNILDAEQATMLDQISDFEPSYKVIKDVYAEYRASKTVIIKD